MRFATIRTSRGLRLHVKGSEGYVDLADATGNETLATLNGLAEGGDRIRKALVWFSGQELLLG